MRLGDFFKHRPYKSRKILLVDDEEDMGWILRKILNNAGHKFIFAATFNKGIQLFKNSKNLTVAIIDLKLANEDGMEFIKKARKINDKVILIMISAFGNPEIKNKARQLGVSYYLDKPLRPEKLLDIINNI